MEQNQNTNIMNIKHAIIIKWHDEPMKVRVTDMEKPMYRSTASEDECDKYKKDYAVWEESLKEYDVLTEQACEDLSKYNYIGNLGHLHHSWYDDIRVGIEVKPDTIAIEQLCIQTGRPCGFPCNGEDNCKKSLYVVIKKKPVEEVVVYVTLREVLLKLSRNKEISVECVVVGEVCKIVISDYWDHRIETEVDVDLTKSLVDIKPFEAYIK